MIDLGLISEKSLSQVVGRIRLHKKFMYIYLYFYLRKLSRFRGQFCSTALVAIDTFYVKYCALY